MLMKRFLSLITLFLALQSAWGLPNFLMEKLDETKRDPSSPGLINSLLNPPQEAPAKTKEIEELFSRNKALLATIKRNALMARTPEQKARIDQDLAALEELNNTLSSHNSGWELYAINAYQSIGKRYPNSIVAPEAFYQAGKLCVARHQYADAFECFDNIVKRYPNYPYFEQTIGEQFEVANQLFQGKRPHYWGIIPGFKNYDSAIKYFESVIRNAPFTEYAPRALMMMAEFAKNKGEQADAVDALDRLISQYPNDKRVPDAYTLMGDVYLSIVRGPENDQGATRKAIDYYQDFITLYAYARPDLTPRAQEGLRTAKGLYARSKIIIGDFFYYRRNHPTAAIALYNEAIEIDPLSPIAQEAQSKIENVQTLTKQGLFPKKPFMENLVDKIFGRYQHAKDNL